VKLEFHGEEKGNDVINDHHQLSSCHLCFLLFKLKSIRIHVPCILQTVICIKAEVKVADCNPPSYQTGHSTRK
jgi:hypothetical protein